MLTVLGVSFWTAIIAPVAVLVALVLVRRLFARFLGRSA